MELLIGATAIFWVVCAVLSWGLTFGYFQGKYPHFAYQSRYQDMRTASMCVLVTLIIAPIGLLMALFLSDMGKYGMHYKPISAEESWQAYHKRWPNSTKENWLL